jgi:hypothetical protein
VGNFIELKSMGVRNLVEEHVLRKFAWVGKGQDITVRPHAERSGVSAVIGQGRSSYSDVGSFLDGLVLEVEYRGVPNLAAVVNDPHFTLVLVDFEQLKYFNLQVKVKARFPVWPCCPDCRHCAERGNELARQHVVFLKHSGRPAAQSFGDVFVGELCVHGLAEKR